MAHLILRHNATILAHLVQIIKLNANMMVQDRKEKVEIHSEETHLAYGSLRTASWTMMGLT